MSLLKKVVPLLLPLLVAAALDGCSSTKQTFRDDQLFSSTASPYSRNFDFSATDACEAARRGLLSQGYMTTMTRTDAVDATKNFQPASDSHVVVEVHVVCTSGDASNTSIVYVNAIQNGYALKKSDTSASVGLSIFGSLSVPIRTNNDAMVKISSETIQSGSFYDKFFELVSRYLRTSVRSEPVPRGAIEITPLPPPVSPSPPVAVVTPTAPAVAVASRAAVAPVIGAAGAAAAAAGGTAAAMPAAAGTAAETAAAVPSATAAAPAHAVAATLPGIGMPPMLTAPASYKLAAEAAPRPVPAAQTSIAQAPAMQTSAVQQAPATLTFGAPTPVALTSAALTPATPMSAAPAPAAQTSTAQPPVTQTSAAPASIAPAATPAPASGATANAPVAAAPAPGSAPTATAPAAQ